MFNSQAPAHMQNHASGMGDPVSLWPFDDDIAIGCECANPALQIERWGQEASAQPPDDCA
jgi:hypothetical protein